MTTTNKNDAGKAAVLERVEAVRLALEHEPPHADRTLALEQCARLELAINQFHAEGLRFAAFTLLRIVSARDAAFADSVRDATRDLKAALETAGYPH